MSSGKRHVGSDTHCAYFGVVILLFRTVPACSRKLRKHGKETTVCFARKLGGLLPAPHSKAFQTIEGCIV